MDNMSSNEPLISVVSPVYKAEKIVKELVRRINNSVSSITNEFEIVLVCDGSPDCSWKEINDICKTQQNVVGINLSRNFGQHYALSAGLQHARGQWIVVMDCDLQDQPEEIPNLFAKAQEGYDMVLAKRVARKDKYLKRLSSTVYNYTYHKLSGLETDKAIANFGIYNKKVIDAFNNMRDTSRSFQSLLAYLGFESTTLEVQHSERFEGRSSYSWRKLLSLSSDVILANSNKPLKIAIKLGLIMTLFAIFLVIYNLIVHLSGNVIPGFSSTIISIWLVGGLNLFVLGIIGLYIDKIFCQVKGRPLFIISEIVNGNELKR